MPSLPSDNNLPVKIKASSLREKVHLSVFNKKYKIKIYIFLLYIFKTAFVNTLMNIYKFRE